MTQKPTSPSGTAAPAGDHPTPASPIADLSYRGYDGPLHTRTMRWWVVALAGIRSLRRKPVFWVCLALACLPYLFTGLRLYFTRTTGFGFNPTMPGAPVAKFAESFYGALRSQGFFLFLIALMAGAGSIAADVRANALQLYLSKPITKGDYALGKWMGTFLPVYSAALLPALVLYTFCLLSYSDDGFLAEDRLLIVRLLIATAVPAALHASLLLGFSAWSRSPFVAGALYAGLYVVSGIVAGLVWTFRYGIPGHFDPSRGTLVRSLSLDGIIAGLVQNIYAVTLRPTFIRPREGFNPQTMTLAPPSFWALLAIAVVLAGLGVAAARMRIRAVEVVRG